MSYTLKVLSIAQVTPNVHCIRLEKPANYNFTPGQATDVIVNKPGWTEEKRPFTFTCLAEDPYLEFTIKSYPERHSVTEQIALLKAGDELLLDDPWGSIEYKGEGYFIAGGAGITPFMAILRRLYKDKKIGTNRLFFSNKTAADIIYEKELKTILGANALFVLTEKTDGSRTDEFIDGAFLDKQVGKGFNRYFYLCGPDPMVNGLKQILLDKGVKQDSIIFEK